MMDSAYKLSILIRYKTEFGIIYNQSILLSAVYQEVISGVSGSTLLHTRRSKGVMDPSHEPYATVLEHRNLNSSIRLVPEWKFLARKPHNLLCRYSHESIRYHKCTWTYLNFSMISLILISDEHYKVLFGRCVIAPDTAQE